MIKAYRIQKRNRKMKMVIKTKNKVKTISLKSKINKEIKDI